MQLLAQEVIKLRREVAQLRAGGAGGAGGQDAQAQIQRLEVLQPSRLHYSLEREREGARQGGRKRDGGSVGRRQEDVKRRGEDEKQIADDFLVCVMVANACTGARS